MNNIEKYVARQTFMPPIFSEKVVENIGMVVAIPAYAETELLISLESIKNCSLPSVGVEVIVHINHPVNADGAYKELNTRIAKEAQEWAKANSNSQIQFLVSDPFELPQKHAGAGLARKIAMDEAVVRLQQSTLENPIIACFDADAMCSDNYLFELERHFKQSPKSLGCSINFEHPVEAEMFVNNAFLTEGIVQYELHLRYYQAALVYANHPQAEFTVGSSMAVTRNAYVAQGGMNRRKAGEDFWFMLKLMMAGDTTAILNATVYPSSRESFRVPFGTGRAMSEMAQKNDNTFYTAPFSSFDRLKQLLTHVDELYEKNVEIDDALTFQFLESQNWISIIEEIREYTTDIESFRKRFYRWLNVFMVMKFFHFLRDEGVEDEVVLQASKNLFPHLSKEIIPDNTLDMLLFFRAKKRVQSLDYTL